MGMGRGDGTGVGVGSSELDARRKNGTPDVTQDGGTTLVSETSIDADTAFFATTSTRAVSLWTSLSMGNTRSAYNNNNFDPHLKPFLDDTTVYDATMAPVIEEGNSQDLNDNGAAKVLYQLMGSLKINTDGSAQFVPKLVGDSQQSCAGSRSSPSDRDKVSAQLSTLVDITHKLEWESLDVPCPYTLPGNLLPAHTIVALIDIYFKSVHTFLPMFHKASFMTLFHQDAPGYRVPPFLLMAMCAVALRHATEHEIQSLTSKISISAQSNLLQHHVLYDYARALLDTYIDVPRLSTVKGLLLLTYYQVKEKRARHFFRMRTYLGLAVRMSLDMGLARGLYSSPDEVKTADTDDTDSTVDSLRLSTASLTGRLSNLQSGSTQQHRTRSEGTSSTRHGPGASKTKQSVEQQEERLTWLACFFLDSLTAGFLGLDFCVTGVHLEMRKLIREANYTADTTQGATLIFWYLHLDLAQLYRRICEMYRGLPASTHPTLCSNVNPRKHLMTRSSIREGADMLSIEHALDKWLANLPNHLIFAPATTAQMNSPRPSTGAESKSTPSYYTLYLHRFYFSLRLLLYRPWISHASLSTIEDLSDPSSAVSRCVAAAKMLTMIGEIIFQNYSWPWPGCGLFAYEMLQAMEIHLFIMIVYHDGKRTPSKGFEDAKGLYLRTMDLLQGYVSLAKLPELKKTTTILDQMVVSYLVSPKEKVSPETLLGRTAYSILQQRQHHLLNQHRQQPRSPLQPQDQQQVSHEGSSPAVAVENSPLGHAHLSPKLQTISLLTQQQLHIGSQHELQHIPQTTALRTEDAHMFSPLLANAGYSTFAETSSSVSAASVPADLFHSFPIRLTAPHQCSQSSIQAIQQQQSPLSSFLYDMGATPPSMSLYDADPAQDMYTSDYAAPYPYFHQQPPQETSEQPSSLPAVGDLLGHGAMGPPPGLPFLSHGSRSSNVPSASSHPPHTQALSRSDKACFSPHPPVPPPKPSKRILAQSTGSTNSSSRSQSQRPPAPKKPSRLNGRNVVADSLASAIAVTALNPSSQSSPLTSSKTASLLDGGTLAPPSSSLASSQRQRPFRTLQAQGQLYGHGALKSSPRFESGDHPTYHELRPDIRATQPEWSFANGQENGLQYLRGEDNHLL
ncbi:hypothetical protein BGZ70_005450 [Mortierella alpina]|uniref:Xylanolytic transcriptional activator regulatory domain-containing protein n=1 Tax=Mortierella alpina TaxID=64518 RepID=A0A9P6JEB9_MORAP|nr:hypothetical protein BGZ70_005450 [Mortierella alpina]